MEFSVPSNVLVLIFIFVSSPKFGFGSAYEYPHLGAAGVVANEYLPQAEVEGASGQFFPQAGIIGTNAPRLFNKALRCLSDRSIYSACDEAHRLSQSGKLDVLPGYTDEYCNGPCHAETIHVLDCIEGIFKGFIFLNTATLNNVRDTIESGCGYGPHRGNFNVLDHIQNEAGQGGSGNGNNRAAAPVICTILLLILALTLLF